MAANFYRDFDTTQTRIWLDNAHQGPLPLVAVKEAREAITWKMWPHLLTADRFVDIPNALRQTLARLVGGEPEEIVLGNSASYGLHLLANGLPLKAGDEVLLVDGDFPATILPWLALQERGVNVRLFKPKGTWVTAEDLADNLIGTTRVFCTSWVNSFNGAMADVDALGQVCRQAGVRFLLNASQGMGTHPLYVKNTPVDALVSVGFKWLLGPYGTGFAWFSPETRDALSINHCYWQALQSAADLADIETRPLPDPHGNRQSLDIFGTANFFNFKPWLAALHYLLDQGLTTIHAHNQQLLHRILSQLDHDNYQPVVKDSEGARSNLLCLEPTFTIAQDVHRALRQAGIDAAVRKGRLRISPHICNNEAHVDRLCQVLASLVL